MPTIGTYQTVRELHRGGVVSVFSAVKMGTGSGAAKDATHAVRVCRPDPAIMGPERARFAVRAFVESMEVQRRAAEAAPSEGGVADGHWAKVYEIAVAPDGLSAHAVTELANPGSLDRLVASRIKLDGVQLAHIAGSIIEALLELRAVKPIGGGGGWRGHGNLKLSNVLLLGTGGITQRRVALCDPAPEPAVIDSRPEAADLRALGVMIYELAMHQSYRGAWPVPESEKWLAIGLSEDGETRSWRDLVNRLLAPGQSAKLPTLEELTETIETLAVRPRRKNPVMLLVGGVALAGVVVTVVILATRPPSAQDKPPAPHQPNPAAANAVPSASWGEATHAQWRELCEAYRDWFGDFARRMTQRPPVGASANVTSRGAWYASVDPDLKPVVNSLTAGEGGEATDPWTIAGVGTDADLLALAQSPTAAAMSEEGIAATAKALVIVREGEKVLSETWSARVELSATVALCEEQGWERAGAYLRDVRDQLQPGGGRNLVSGIDSMLRLRPMITSVRERWGTLQTKSKTIAEAHDQVLDKFAPSLAAMATAAPGAGGSATGSRPATAGTGTAAGRTFAPEVDALSRSLTELTELTDRLVDFIEKFVKPQNLDTDSLTASPAYAALLSQPVTRQTFETWLFEARGHPSLDPNLDPRRTWEVPKTLATVRDRVGTFTKPPLSGEMEPELGARIEAAERAVEELAPEKSSWNRKNQQRIEGEAQRLAGELRDLRAALESRIADRRTELAATAEQVRADLRADNEPFGSAALSAAWRTGRDALLTQFAAEQFQELRASAKALKAALKKGDEAMPAAPGVQDLASLGGAWAAPVAEAAAKERERRMAAALAGPAPSGAQGEDRYATVIAAQGAEYGAWLAQLSNTARTAAAIEAAFDGGRTLDEPLLASPSSPTSPPAGDKTIGQTYAAMEGDQLLAMPELARAAAPMRERVEAHRALAQQADAGALAASIRDARRDRPDLALAAWRRLCDPAMKWPATSKDLEQAAALAPVMSRVVGSIGDDIRRGEVNARVQRDLSGMWVQAATNAQQAADLESVLARQGEFAVKPADVPARVQFNALVWRSRAALAGADPGDGATADALKAFAAGVKALPAEISGSSNVAKLVAEVESLAAGAEPTTPAIDPKTLGPGSVGWAGSLDEANGLLVFQKGSAQIAFIRLDPVPGGGGGAEALTEPVYVSQTEVSVGLFAELVGRGASASVLSELEKAMPRSDPRADPWVGPRSWMWASGTGGAAPIKPGEQWIWTLGTNISKDIPAYPPGILDAAGFTRVGAAAGGEPVRESPMQSLPPTAAQIAAASAGCRLPTVAEWTALYNQFGKVAEAGGLSGWNLRDQMYATQLTYVTASRSRVLNQESFQWPDSGTAGSLLREIPRGQAATAVHPFNDSVLWFRPVSSGSHVARNLVGNVAEYVLLKPPGAGTATATIADGAGRMIAAAGLGVIGGSALSDPSQDVTKAQVVDIGDAIEGFSDVGFRVAFSAPGTAPPRETLAAKASRVLTENVYLIAK